MHGRIFAVAGAYESVEIHGDDRQAVAGGAPYRLEENRASQDATRVSPLVKHLDHADTMIVGKLL